LPESRRPVSTGCRKSTWCAETEIALAGSVTPLRFLQGSKDVIDLLLSPPRQEDIYLVYYETSRAGTEGTLESSSRGGEVEKPSSPPLDSSTF
jgi:hypothetical protein